MEYREESPKITPEEFEFEGVENDLAKKYQPKFIDQGGEHIVYEIPDHPDVVIKVAKESLKSVIDFNIEHGQPVDSLPKEIQIRAREYLKKEAERYQQLKKYFGSDHVLAQKKVLLKVPVTESILTHVYEGKAPATNGEAWSITMIQERAHELSDPEHLTLVAGYAEQGKIEAEAYNQATEHLVFSKDPGTRLDENDFLAIQSNADLKLLLKEAENDNELMGALREVIEKTIVYTEETGEILDLIGENNLTFSRKDEKWTYRLIDALYPRESKMIEKTKAILLKLSAGIEIEDDEQNILMNALNFVRTINGLAEQLSIQKRINIVPEGMKKQDLDYFAIINKNLTFYQS
jgi:hypothetical protein